MIKENESVINLMMYVIIYYILCVLKIIITIIINFTLLLKFLLDTYFSIVKLFICMDKLYEL